MVSIYISRYQQCKWEEQIHDNVYFRKHERASCDQHQRPCGDLHHRKDIFPQPDTFYRVLPGRES